MSKTIAVDFDGCLILYKAINWSEPNKTLIAKLIQAKQKGHKIILWTCRENEKLQEAVEWCKKLGLEFDAVNENLDPEETEADHKIRANVYVDDLAMQPDNFIINFEL